MNSVQITSRKFYCQHRNGDTFASLPADFVTYLQSAVIEKLKLVEVFEVSTVSIASPTVRFNFSTDGSEIKVFHPFNGWANEGFVVGNTFVTRDPTTGNTRTCTVTNIAGQYMWFTATTFFSSMAWTDGDNQDSALLSVTTAPTSLIFKFGFNENGSGFSTSADSYNSILDGQEQLYSTNGITGVLTDLDYLSSESSNLGTVQAKYDGVSGTDSEIFTFTVEHVFRVPHFKDSWQSNYIAETIPDTFQGTNSFRYASYLNFGVNVNNPNDGKVFTDGFQLGSVGFIGQNFNAGSTVYTRETSTTYTISGSSVNGPEVTLTTAVTAQIKKNNGNFTAGVKGYVYHSKLPTAPEYSNNSNTYEENFVLDQEFETDGGGTSSSDIIKSLTVSINGGDPSLLDISFNLNYPAADQDRFEQDDYIFLGVVVEDVALSATLSDRTLVELDTIRVTKDADVKGLLTNFQGDITIRGGATARTDVDNWINQLYEMDFTFDLAKEADSQNSRLTGLKLQQVAFDLTALEYFVLDEYNFPLVFSHSPVVDGTQYQVINLDTTRVLSVPADDSAREVQLTMTAPGSYSATQTVTGKIGFVVPWQEWIPNNNVDPVFYNGSLPLENFNLNQRMSNYSDVNNYEYYIFLVADVLYNAITTQYIMVSDASDVGDFGDDVTGNGWSLTTKIYDDQDDETNTIFNQDCRIECEFAMPTAGAITIGDVMGTICIEETGNTGTHFRLHTAIDWTAANNPLKPLTGETYVKMTQDVPGNTITLECLVDGTMLDPNKTYNIYAHLNSNR